MNFGITLLEQAKSMYWSWYSILLGSWPEPRRLAYIYVWRTYMSERQALSPQYHTRHHPKATHQRHRHYSGKNPYPLGVQMSFCHTGNVLVLVCLPPPYMPASK